MRFKLAILILAVFVMSVMLPACDNTKTKSNTEDSHIVIGMSQVGAESDWRLANTESMRTAFSERNGYRLLYDDARQEQENQFSAIRRFIQQRVDYIVVMPIAEEGWDSVLEEAREAGIPVIVVDRMVDVDDESLVTAHVGANFYEEGRKAVEWIEKNHPTDEDINIIHIQGTNGSTAQLGRTAALNDALKKHSSWKLQARLDGDFTEAKTYEVLDDYLMTVPGHPKIDVLYCENDNEAYGAIKALEKAGYECGPDGVSVISFDATYNALLMCREGKIAMTVECNPLLGPLTESVIKTMEEGKAPEKNRYVEETVFTSDDITDKVLEGRQY